MLLFLVILGSVAVRFGVAASLADFTKCISAQGQGPVCQLDAGTYVLSTPLTIGRSNITIKGTITNSLAETTLRRAPGSTRGLLAAYDQTLNSITVRDFTFDGGGGQMNGIESDVRLGDVKSALVTHCALINSPFLAMGIGSGAVVNNIVLDGAAYLGILRSSTPGVPAAMCSAYTYVSNIVIANSTFQNVGANAIAIEARDVRILNNTLKHNHDTSPYGAPGGQIYVEICADNVAMEGNTVLDGPATANGYYAEGLELHGTNLVVVNNTIKNNAGNGIEMSGVQDVFIANWTPGSGVISNDVSNGYVGGISLYNPASGDGALRPADYVTIDHAVSISGRLSGIGIFLETGQTAPINHVTLTNNCLAGNLQGPTKLSGLGPDVLIANNLSAGCPLQ